MPNFKEFEEIRLREKYPLLADYEDGLHSDCHSLPIKYNKDGTLPEYPAPPIMVS